MTLLLYIGVAYISLCVIFYFTQHFFFFRPEILPQNFAYKYEFPFEEVHFDMEDGGVINGLIFKVPNSKGVVFYFKGNSRSIKGWAKFARDFVSKGYDFFMIDYRGFGKSTGKRSENILYNDGQHVYKWLTEQYAEKDIIIYGRSLGSGIATRIASWNKPHLLILDSPYFSFFYQIRRFAFILPIKWLLRYQIRTDQFIKKVHCPVFILHGTKDRLIPINQSKKLVQLVPQKIELFEIEGGGHNNLPEYAAYHDYLYDILNEEALYNRVKDRFSETEIA